jgi:signal peptidase I
MHFGRKQVEVLAERTKIPADGKSSSKLCLRYKHPPGNNVLLKLTRRGSFEPNKVVREKAFPVENGEVNLTVYAPTRPGPSYLTGEGFRYKLDFAAASFMQGLVFEWVPTIFWALLLALLLRNYAIASFYIPSGSMENTLMTHDLLIADKFSYKVLQQDPRRGDIMIFQYPLDRKKDYIKRVIGLPGDIVKIRDKTVYVNGTPLNEDYIKEKPWQDYGPKTVPRAGDYDFIYTSDPLIVAPTTGSSGDQKHIDFETIDRFDYTGIVSYQLESTPESAVLAGKVALKELGGGVDRHINLHAGLFTEGSDTPLAVRELKVTQPEEKLSFGFAGLEQGRYTLRVFIIQRDCYLMMGDNRNDSRDGRAWGFVPRDYFEGRAMVVFWPPQRIKVIKHIHQSATLTQEAAPAGQG